MSRQSIDSQAKLIASLGDTMHDGMWADDILNRCSQIEAAVAEIRKIANGRRAGER